MKARIFSLLLLLVILLSSCAVFEKETFMPTVRVGYAFENDTWLIIEDRLIRKEDGTVLWLEMDKDQKIPGTYATYVEASAERTAYRYVFNEASFEQYTFLTAYGSSYLSTNYYECVVTYGYDGKEIGRTAISGPLTKEEMHSICSLYSASVVMNCSNIYMTIMCRRLYIIRYPLISRSVIAIGMPCRCQ